MKSLDYLKILINSFFNRIKSKERRMKRVFQWRRFLEWKDLTSEEKLSAKRFLLIPVFTYLIVEIINKNFSLIILFLIGYIIYKKFEKGGIIKK